MLTPEIVFRNYETAGVPDSGKHDPKKSEIIQLLNLLFGVSRGGWVVARTQAELLVITPDDEADGGVVLNDPDPAKNGYYSRVAAAWVRQRGFPDTFAKVALSGSTTAQTGTVNAGVNPSSIEVFFAKVVTPNSGPLTLSIDDGPARSVINLAGNPLTAGEWTGMVMFYLNDADQYQLLIDAGAAASAAASATAAGVDADRAQSLADSIVPGTVLDESVTEPKLGDTLAQVLVHVVADRAALKALDTTRFKTARLNEPGRVGNFVWMAGDYSAQVTADTLEGIFIEAADVAASAGAWVRLDTEPMRPEWFGAIQYTSVANAVSGADSYPAIQASVDLLQFRGGGTVRLSAFYKANTPILLNQGVNMIGVNKERCGIVKDSGTTKACDVTAVSMVPNLYPPETLPDDINAVIILDNAGDGRYKGVLSDFTIQSTLASSDRASMKTIFGIVSIGSVSDTTISRINVNAVQFGILIPTVFVTEISGNRVSDCLHGIGLGGGTSVVLEGNYSNNCRTYGYYLRGMIYSKIQANACDYLNRPDWYFDRASLCRSYVFDSCSGFIAQSNGQEECWAAHWTFLTCRHFEFMGNTSVGLGSDYVGSSRVAWIYSDDAMQFARIENNFSYSYMTAGLLQGGASPTLHHNVWFSGLDYVFNVTFKNNLVKETMASLTIGGWENNSNAGLMDAPVAGINS